MTNPADAPADTTMMRIVHDALRRDLARARDVLASDRTDDAQRTAVADHLTWMMQVLHAHHASEDDGLYPFMRARAVDDPDALAVIDRMTSDHEAIATAVTDVARAPSVAALDALSAVLLPHLRREEDEAMPIASRLVTVAEWQAIEKEHNLDGKSRAELGFEGHWLIDGANDADRATVLELVPPVPRFVLLHGYARRYRRHAAACWGTKPRRRVQMQNDVAVDAAADIEAVWAIVRDVTRVGEWSHECIGAAWLDGATAAVPSARFRGRNRAGLFRWGRVCEIISAEPHELVWRTVSTGLYPDSSEWRIVLERIESGTRITQQFRVVRAPKVLSVLYALAVPGHRDRTAALTEDLQRLAAVANGLLSPT